MVPQYVCRICAPIVESKYFSIGASMMLLASVILIGIEADDPENGTEYEITDLIISIWFTVEICLRILCFPTLWNFLNCPRKKLWNRFDFVFLIVLIAQSWVLPIFYDGKTFQFLLVIRTLRLLRIFSKYEILPEVMIYLKGILVAFVAVSVVLMFQLTFIYVLSIIMVVWARSTDGLLDPTVNDSADELYYYFSTVGYSILTFFQLMIADGAPDVMLLVIDESVAVGIVLIVYYAFSTIMLFNILIGSVCEVVQRTSDYQREKLTLQEVEVWRRRWIGSDIDTVSEAEWKQILWLLRKNLEHDYQCVLDPNRIESAAIVATNDGVVNVKDIPSLYIKVGHSVDSQDLVACINGLNSLYDLAMKKFGHAIPSN
jgi:hypothetical protein